MSVLAEKMSLEDGTQWYKLNGTDFGTGYEFDNDVYGITEDNVVVDCDNCPITEGDFQEIAIRNTIK